MGATGRRRAHGRLTADNRMSEQWWERANAPLTGRW